jgi:hypothetical protein
VDGVTTVRGFFAGGGVAGLLELELLELDDDEDVVDDEDELATSTIAFVAFAGNGFGIIILGAVFKTHNNSSVNSTNPIDVKKLMANLAFVGLSSRGKRPAKYSCSVTSFNRLFSFTIPMYSASS